jgi:NADH:ubiquinone oxidoreductase subunit 2 (subunit N)
MPISEWILGFCILAQAVLLALPHGRKAFRSAEVLAGAGFLASAVAVVMLHLYDAGLNPLWTALLEDQPLFRLPRAALFLAALLLGRNVIATGELPPGRKQETLLLLTVLVFLCDLLILSRHALLSSVLLASISWLGIFLSGLAFRGRVEGEAVLKSWLQVSLAVALGFGSVLVLALVSGGLHYEVIAAQMKTLSLYSPEALLTILALCLPFFLAGGIFPFHFISLDRDQGLPWAVQVILTIIVQGSVTLAAWKMGVEVFGSARPGQVAEGMRVLQLAGLAGGFWLAIFAFSQENAKRLFSAIVGAQWFAILAAGAMPTKLGVSAITYAFSSVFLWTALLGFVWSRLQESVGSEKMESVHGAARSFRMAGLMLLIALTGPLYAPGFTGFPSVFHLLASMIEQRSLVFLAAEGVLLAVLCLSALRIGTDLLFRPAPQRDATNAGTSFSYGVLDFGAMILLGATILVLGVFWYHAFAALNDAAGLFLL